MNESIFQKEQEKSQEIFKDVEPSKPELVEGLLRKPTFSKQFP